MCVQNLNFVASPVPDIMAYPKKLYSPWIRPLSLFQKFLMGIIRMKPLNALAKVELKFVAFPVPQIVGGTENIWAILNTPRSLFSQLFMGFCADGPFYCSGQI